MWTDSVDESESKIIFFRFLWVVFGITSSQFLLIGTIRYYLENYISSDRDETSGCESVESRIQFYKKAKQIIRDMGFNLRKWVTNNSALQSIIDKNENVKSIPTDELTYSEVQFKTGNEFKSVLAIKWNIVKHEFVFNLEDCGSECIMFS